MTDTPHFALPFRFSGGSTATNEQDSYDDVADCIEAIVRTPQGWRDDSPLFGLPDVLLRKQPIGTDALTDTINSQEPRADIAMSENPDLIDQFTNLVNLEVFPAGGQS